MQQLIHDIRTRFQSELSQAHKVADVEDLRVRYLGRKGPVQDLMKELKGISDSDRPAAGKAINDLKVELTAGCDGALKRFSNAELYERLSQETLDITLPGRKQHHGNKHIVNHAMDEMIDILIEMGFSVQEGPEVETEYYNFEALNFPADHPAKDMQDTFYINDEFLLRTQTSNIQARVMESSKPPIRIICPGRVYRNETVTARSHVFFHQVEGLYIDKNVSFGHLLATIEEFLHKLIGKSVQIRYRPSYFPFVEPGLEVDISCSLCNAKGCGMCKGSGWVEVLGAGMVHPEVLKNGGIDPEEYSGYAWGMGVERLVNIKYGVNDIRRFTENDLRFLQQFNGV